MKLRTVVVPLLIANIFVFVLQAVLGAGFTEAFLLASEDIFTRPWILLTSMFLHGGASHLFFNMYGLFLFGPLLEQKIGPKKFLFIYLASGLIAAFVSSFFYSRALGASAAIMGMIGTLIIVMPNLRLLFLFFVPMPLWVAGIVWFLIDFFGIFIPSGIANIAHIVGMGTGLLFGLYLIKQKRKFSKRFHSKTHLDQDDIEDYLSSGRI